MTLFRPCIDLHQGKVKQIVGGSYCDEGTEVQVNYESSKGAEWFAERYAKDGLTGGHVIQLGTGNQSQARAALRAYPEGLQIGGGVQLENAADWLEAGASHVIVTSYIFSERGEFLEDRLQSLVNEVGRERLVLDLSCRGSNGDWVVAMNRWQTPTNLKLSKSLFLELSKFCAEFLIHAADVEGRCEGIDRELVRYLGDCVTIPTSYAGGAQSVLDLAEVDRLSEGKVDLTIGSALDIFGGTGASYTDCVAWNKAQG